jgi:hypothetical protein
MKFFLGTHMPNWLEDRRFVDVPLFVSRRTLARMQAVPRSVTSWALDSGGFTELSMYGKWRTPSEQYVAEVRRFQSEVGRLQWAAPQDWMCEPIITQKTGLTVRQHQKRTVDNFLKLRDMAPDLPFVPVVQGWELSDYLRCVEMYEAAGVNLRAFKTVGVGTVCRRQATDEAAEIMRNLAGLGLKLHGFGFKTKGLLKVQRSMVSADSLAWSFAARMEDPLPGHDRPGPGRPLGHQACSNCPVFALRWRRKLLSKLKKGG